MGIDVPYIEAINQYDSIGGETGAGFAIKDRNDIEAVIKNIQSADFKRDGLSVEAEICEFLLCEDGRLKCRPF